MVTERDVDRYQTFGFVVLRNVLSADEMRRLREEACDAMTKAFADEPYDGSKPHWLPLVNPHVPFSQSLFEDPRFHDAAQQLSGADELLPFTVDANRTAGDTAWHGDTYEQGVATLKGVKFAAYLDAVTATTGALRVIPGSHREPYSRDVAAFFERHRDALGIADVPCVVCETVPGDVVAFNYAISHASLGGSGDRWMVSIEFLEHARSDEEAEFLRSVLTQLIDRAHNPDYPTYHPGWIANPERNAVRQRLIDRMRELRVFESAG